MKTGFRRQPSEKKKVQASQITILEVLKRFFTILEGIKIVLNRKKKKNENRKKDFINSKYAVIKRLYAEDNCIFGAVIYFSEIRRLATKHFHLCIPIEEILT